MTREGRNWISRVHVSSHSMHGYNYSDLLQAYKEGTFDSPGLPPGCVWGSGGGGGGGGISASALPHLGVSNTKRKEKP